MNRNDQTPNESFAQEAYDMLQDNNRPAGSATQAPHIIDGYNRPVEGLVPTRQELYVLAQYYVTEYYEAGLFSWIYQQAGGTDDQDLALQRLDHIATAAGQDLVELARVAGREQMRLRRGKNWECFLLNDRAGLGPIFPEDGAAAADCSAAGLPADHDN